jgi:hypothetical protein
MSNKQLETAAPVHSRIGASSYYRWKACPGSVSLCEGLPEMESPYAAEGTRAHDIAARLLSGQAIPEDVDPEMLEAVMVYVNAVKAAAEQTADSKMLIEHKFNLTKVFDGLYGTADCVIFHPSRRLLQVWDYKHGAGIPVEVAENEQLLYYGLGALISTQFPCTEVELIIVQPRCNHPDGAVRSWKTTVSHVLDFAIELAEDAAKTLEKDAPLSSGDHCRFCKAAGICPQIHKDAQSLARIEFSPVLSYDPKALADTLDKLDVVEAWAKSVREFAYREAQHGRIPPGYKLVEKRATRKWTDEQRVLQIAEQAKLSDMTETCLKSVAQAEKTLGKKDFEYYFAPYVVAVSSGLTLAHESDKRPPAQIAAKAEFTKIE